MEEKKEWKKKIPMWIKEGLFEEVTDDRGTRILGYVNCSDKVLDFIEQEIDRARKEGYQKGWEDGSKGKVFEKIEVETEVTFKDLRDVIEGREDAGEFLSKLTTK